MLNILIESANIVRNKYKFEIDGCFNTLEFLRAKLSNEITDRKRLRKNLYKKLKK